MSHPQVKAMVSMLAKEVAKRAMMVGTTAPALIQLSHTLLGELSIPMTPAAREEFTQAITGMVGMDESQVEAQVGEFNRIYAKQVMLHVEVYAVERQKGDDYSINWNALWSRASNALGFSFTSAGGSGAGPAFTIDVNDPNSAWNGSNVVGRALSTLGNTTLLTSGTVISLNGQTVPLNVSREQAYVQSASTNLQGSNSNLATTTLTPGVATEGFSMNFTPRILDNNQVLVRYSIDLSVIEDIQTFTGGSTTIQLPRRSVRNFLQNVSVPSGNSLVLTGFQQTQGTRGGEGPFGSGSWFLGGSKTADSTSRTIVIVVTPFVTQQ